MWQKKQDWSPGDILVNRWAPSIRREIVDVRETGYGWRYPEEVAGENYFWSENSSDPFLQWGSFLDPITQPPSQPAVRSTD